VVDTGAFASLKEADVEGFIPLRELSSGHVSQAKEVVSKGQKVNVKLLDLDATAHKMPLSLMAAETESDRQEYEEYMKSQQAPAVRLGDQFGEVLNQTKASLADSEPPDEDTDEPAEPEPADEQAETPGPDEPAPTAPAELESSAEEADAESDEADEEQQTEASDEEEVS